MNIFALDEDPAQAAAYHCDKHAAKTILETAQMLSTSLARHGVVVPGLYRKTHARHPCTLWVGDTRANFVWLTQLGLALNEEHQRRFKPATVHKSTTVIQRCLALASSIPDGPLTPFAVAVSEECKRTAAVESYRAYYCSPEKARFTTWKAPASVPEWWVPEELTCRTPFMSDLVTQVHRP